MDEELKAAIGQLVAHAVQCATAHGALDHQVSNPEFVEVRLLASAQAVQALLPSE